jgi:hypothetical protein
VLISRLLIEIDEIVDITAVFVKKSDAAGLSGTGELSS